MGYEEVVTEGLKERKQGNYYLKLEGRNLCYEVAENLTTLLSVERLRIENVP